MVTDEQVRWIALFYLFSIMDERVALQAAHKTVAHLKATAGAKGLDSGEWSAADETKEDDSRDCPRTPSRAAIVRILAKGFQHHRKLVPRNKPLVMPESSWALPEGFDIAPWARFQKDAAEAEIIAVIFSKLLGFSDQEIADGLGVTLGTARYRIGKGVRQLGLLAKVRA